jgi:hypothetical protein
MKEGIERFSMYAFSIDYPEVCRLELNPKTTRQKGDLVLHFPDREKMFVSWGELDDAKKAYGTAEAQAEQTIKAASKDARTKGLVRLEKESIQINSHIGIYNHVRLEQAKSGLIPRRDAIKHDIFSLHLHCDLTSRYFVVYSMPSQFAPEDFGDLFKDLARSVECHLPNGRPA